MVERRALVEQILKKKRGAQIGNQNARTHNLYSKCLTPEERRMLKKAASVEGLDSEIALLRVKIQTLAFDNPENAEVLTKAVNT